MVGKMLNTWTTAQCVSYGIRLKSKQFFIRLVFSVISNWTQFTAMLFKLNHGKYLVCLVTAIRLAAH